MSDDVLVGHRLYLLEPSGGGTKATGFVAPALAADVIYTLPNADGVAGQVQATDGATILDWVPGPLGSNVVTKTANYAATALDYVILCDASGGVFTITLPAAATALKRVYNIKKIDLSGNVVTLDPDGTETIDGDLTVPLSAPYESLMLVTDGSNWFVL